MRFANTLAIHVAIVAAVGIRLAACAAASPAKAMEAEDAPAAASPAIGAAVMDAAMLITTAEATDEEAGVEAAPEPLRCSARGEFCGFDQNCCPGLDCRLVLPFPPQPADEKGTP
ncbi:hypothetical protein C8Q80DRAFT_1271138 [Daedaleopsis nitida]|nr:hypothetical protein C8Q80DRAFT_1271138 [Daedaleopsis nitida]